MTHFIADPKDPSEVVPDDKDEELCCRCDEPAVIWTDDTGFCQEHADEVDAAAENEFDRQKESGGTTALENQIPGGPAPAGSVPAPLPPAPGLPVKEREEENGIQES